MADSPTRTDTPPSLPKAPEQSAGPSSEVQRRLDALRAQKEARQDVGETGAGSGPWFDEGANHREGGAVQQVTEGSCVSAAGEMLTDGRVTQEQLHARLGDWSNPTALRDDLNERDGGGWKGGYFAPGDAARQASERPMAAVVQAPGAPGHMVMLEHRGDGTFTVRDPCGNSSYDVDSAWIDKYVSAGVWQE